MKLLIFVYMIVVLAFQFHIQNEIQTNQIAIIQGNFRFANQTGQGCTSAEFSSFINYINLASSYYRTDYKKTLNYISTELKKSYGTQVSSKYSVILQTSDTYYSWYIYSTNSEFATTSPKVDRNFPASSYIFIRRDDQYYQNLDVYFQTLKTGSGIISGMQNRINKIILSLETTSSCYCFPKDISDKLVQSDGQSWNVVCSESQNLYFYIYAKNWQYIYTKPKNCYYGIWVH